MSLDFFRIVMLFSSVFLLEHYLMPRLRHLKSGLAVLRVHQFAEHLASFNPLTQNNDITHWRRFVMDFYSPTGVMRQGLVHSQKNETKQFEITTHLLARYYHTLFQSGIKNVQMFVEQPREKQMGQGTIVDCGKTSFIYWFENECHVSLNLGISRVPSRC